MPNADIAQRRFVIRLMRVRSPSPVNTMNARSLARPGIGAVPARQRDGIGVDLLHVGRQRHAEIARAAAAAEHERVDAAEPRRERRALGVGDDPLHLPELGLRASVAVRAQQHRHGAEHG